MQSLIDYCAYLFNQLVGWINYFIGYAVGWIVGILYKLIGLLFWAFEYLLQPWWDILDYFISWLDLPNFWQKVDYLLNGMFGYWVELFMLDTLLEALLIAHMVRFLIRRIPIIG